MTVYVDDMRASFRPKHAPHRLYVMSHMIGDDEDELHAMAAAIGVARRWYQGDHYDVTQAAKMKALERGAVPITWKQAGTMMACVRMYQAPMPAPGIAEETLRGLMAEGK